MTRAASTPPQCLDAYRKLIVPYSLRLTWLEMGVARSWMQKLAMVYEAEYQPGPPLPLSDCDEWDRAGLAEHVAANEVEWAAAAQTVPGMKGIPVFKTLSNGPWLVTDQEIREALDIYAAADPELRTEAEAEADPNWAEWLDWLRTTEQHGGFRLH